MVSAINSCALDAVAHALSDGPVPLLVLRLPEFERIAWREGKRAARRVERATLRIFHEASQRAVRAGDLTLHEPGSDLFLIAMTARGRAARLPSPVDCRTVLERVGAAVSLDSGLRVETGWTLVQRNEGAAGIDAAVGTALERGARERERYEFFSTIGHELRTPLTSIRGYLETLLDGDADPALAPQFLETARRETLRMARLLDGMLEFSLLDLSADALAQTCQLNAQIDAACEVVRPLAQLRGITLRVATSPPVNALLDADAALQLLINLIENAIKYGREGGVVNVDAQASGAEAVVRVDDDGPGIDPAERDAIFGLRVRGAQSFARPGHGIGLAIVKMIAERAGGAVRVDRSPLGGARFEVALPTKAEFGISLS